MNLQYMIPKKLRNYFFGADLAFISVPKSGRTWLRAMINHYFYLLYPLAVTSRNYEYEKKIPLINYTHGSFSKHRSNKLIESEIKKINGRYSKKIILFRDPRDIVVSYYNHVVYGHHYPSKDNKWKSINITEFIRSEEGIGKIVNHMKMMERNINKDDTCIIKFEEVKKDSVKTLQKILEFINCNIIDKKIIQESIAYCTIDKMRKREIKGMSNEFQISSRNRNTKGVNSLKSRKGNVGNYADEIKLNTDLEYINKICKGFGSLLSEYNIP